MIRWARAGRQPDCWEPPTRCAALRRSTRADVPFRNPVVFPLAVPEDRDDPPARSVVEELDAVDAPGERLGIRGRAQGLVGAEHVGDVAEAVLASADLALEEAVAL